ncbi:MAG: glutamate synthase large subunit [Marinifilaceae bacterium]
MQNNLPKRQGLYDPDNEHDACGVGLLVNINGGKSHEIVDNALTVLENMVHRGAEGADPHTGDGAGITVQIPHEYILLQGIPLPEKGRYGVGMMFLPQDKADFDMCIATISKQVEDMQMHVLALRHVPVNNSILGTVAKTSEPAICQLFVTDNTQAHLSEAKLYLLRKRIEKAVLSLSLTDNSAFYIASLSTRTIIYKGMLSSLQLRSYYPDLNSPYFTSGLALVHSRFSTNTFPTWALAQPFRMLGHNGEINTIRGNRSWMEARESVLNPGKLGSMDEFIPIIQPNMSDSASLDNVLEFFVMSGLSLPHALSMLVPESFNDKNPISLQLKAFYEYHSILMEPWEGPAALLFTDGRYAGGMLDRNGLRPARYLITTDGMMVMASETGVLPIDSSRIKEKGRLRPGKMILIDTELGKIYNDKELKTELAQAKPYGEWLSNNRIHLDNITSGRTVTPGVDNYMTQLKAFGYHVEDIKNVINPMAITGAEPTSSMGNDTPLAVFSNQPQRLFNYFRQNFAQVTNPPIDPIRESLVMSLTGYIGAINNNLLMPAPELCKMVRLEEPILTNAQLDILCNLRYKGFRTEKLSMLFPVVEGTSGMEKAIEALCQKAEQAVDNDFNYLILSDRGVTEQMAAIPSLLAVAAVHNYLISKRKRVQIALIVESGEPREVMHFALLFGYGASAVCPYLAYAVLDNQVKQHEILLDYQTAQQHYIKAVSKGLLKIMSKMGISTLMSYKGAKIFEAIGISQNLLDKYFGSTISKIEGADLQDLTSEILTQHMAAFDIDSTSNTALPFLGHYAYRRDGIAHAWNPQTIAALQHATRVGSYAKFKEFTSLVDNKMEPMFIRDFLDYKTNPIDIKEVESVESITRRFMTGAMSFGSISKEAHEAMAIAMNKIGGRSNTGEGGEDPHRYIQRQDGVSTRSAIKQVASARFGVTTEYLVNADEIQIKVAQGAKPGEGGQLPGYKVDEVIAKTRHSIPGISLISPPPHHDIYSIEDLAQLIFDLRNVNPRARISVKLVAESGIGTIAAGVAKAKADMIIISGAEGGTGASAASSIKHAGLPPEIGLSETQQTLVLNNLRGQVTLQTDGQLKTGRDIVIMAMLGAEEFAFATSALIVLGCVMMRKCHLNTCPVGVATQNEELRKRFLGRSEYLVNFFTFLAQDVREHLARIGVRSMDEIIGRVDMLHQQAWDTNSKTEKVDLSRILYRPEVEASTEILRGKGQSIDLSTVLDQAILRNAASAIQLAQPMDLEFSIANTNRSVGAMLSGVIAQKYGNNGLPNNTINATFRGSAGQSFGAFLSKGVTFRLEGDANDYLGKGLSGGTIALLPSAGSKFTPQDNIIAGNTLLYGATSGQVYINGKVGERFCVRNSGAIAVVEGTGDHCCEYMTGGRAIILGTVGRNFAAGMSGGIAYVLDQEGDFDYYCNMEMVELTLVEAIADRRELKQLIHQHWEYTSSPLAQRILADWDNYVDKFIKVTPIEYKRVLHEERIKELDKKINQVQRDF